MTESKIIIAIDGPLASGTGQAPKGGAEVETALDHRIAMSFMVLGMATPNPVTIDDVAPIKTSFPNFIDLMKELGGSLMAKNS